MTKAPLIPVQHGILARLGFALAIAAVAQACSSGAPGTTVTGSPFPPVAEHTVGVIPLPTVLPAHVSYEDAIRLFQGGRTGSLDVVVTSATEEEGSTVHDLGYSGVYGRRYQAYLVIPAGSGPFGAVMYLHGAGGSSQDFLPEGLELARRGIAVLLINQPEHFDMPDPATAASELAYEMREMDRALALLAARPEVDPDRLGFVGFSFGAVRGATFAGFEGGRLRIAILASLPSSYDTPAMASFDPIAWVGHVSPAALYLQEGTQDTWFTREEAETLIAAAHEPKELQWYEAGHGLDQQSYLDRLDWLVRALGPQADSTVR